MEKINRKELSELKREYKKVQYRRLKISLDFMPINLVVDAIWDDAWSCNIDCIEARLDRSRKNLFSDVAVRFAREYCSYNREVTTYFNDAIRLTEQIKQYNKDIKAFCDKLNKVVKAHGGKEIDSINLIESFEE